MRKISWTLMLLLLTPAMAATKMTVDQLKQTLIEMKQSGKSDEDVATRLKQVDLTEELTHSAKTGLLQYLPGDLSTEQMLIIQGRSAFLPPPADNVPATAAPDAAAQKAILAKASDYLTKTFGQLPTFTASKMISRYQDDVTNTSSSPGLTVNGPNSYTKLADADTERVETEKGVEKPGEKEKTNWGQNGQVSPPGPIPALPVLFQEASDGGKISFERWQIVEGKTAAVFTFAVDKKKSRYDVAYCCFPKTDTATGVAAMGTFAPVPGEIQSVTSYRPFKKTVSYHGELCVNPEDGTILRVTTFAELKPTDYVHQEAVRSDYSPVVVDGKEYVLPLDSFTVNEVVPGGESNSIAYSVRHMLFNVTYANYQMRK
jgi:hypothetical protein